jgi:LAO/AO transport system kinase
MLSEQSKENARQKAIEALRNNALPDDINFYFEGLQKGNRTILAHCISLVESTREDHRTLAHQLINKSVGLKKKAIRIGITGVPGVGKSTFIEAFGSYLTGLGLKLAVLAIDPSSPISKGSILGDKTRMAELSKNPNAFIRPSPTSSIPGGVARCTRESIILCEAAGYDIVLVETVGVGQSETAVYDMTDMFILLMLAGAGDQLQGIKRGIMEMADLMLITKADGGNEKAATLARAEYLSALHLFPPKDHGMNTKVGLVSSIHGTGIESAWENIRDFIDWMKARGLFEKRRQDQLLSWMHESIDQSLLNRFYDNKTIQEELSGIQKEVLASKISPFEAADMLIKKLDSMPH